MSRVLVGVKRVVDYAVKVSYNYCHWYNRFSRNVFVSYHIFCVISGHK